MAGPWDVAEELPPRRGGAAADPWAEVEELPEELTADRSDLGPYRSVSPDVRVADVMDRLDFLRAPPPQPPRPGEGVVYPPPPDEGPLHDFNYTDLATLFGPRERVSAPMSPEDEADIESKIAGLGQPSTGPRDFSNALLTDRTLGPRLSDPGARNPLPEIESTAHMQRAPADTRPYATFGSTMGAIPGTVAGRFEMKSVGAQEIVASHDARTKYWQALTLPDAIRHVDEQNRNALDERDRINYDEDPLIIQAAQHAGVRPDVFTRDWPDILKMEKDGTLENFKQENRALIAEQDARLEGLAHERQDIAAELQRIRPRFESEFGGNALLFDAGTSLITDMAPSLLAGIAAGPGAGLMTMGGLVYPEEFANIKNEGGSDTQATFGALARMAAEIAPEGGVMEIALKTPFGKDMLRSLLGKLGEGKSGHVIGLTGAEAASEEVTELINVGLDKGWLNPEMTWGEAFTRLARAPLIGAGMGGTMGVLTSPLPEPNLDASAFEYGTPDVLPESRPPPPPGGGGGGGYTPGTTANFADILAGQGGGGFAAPNLPQQSDIPMEQPINANGLPFINMEEMPNVSVPAIRLGEEPATMPPPATTGSPVPGTGGAVGPTAPSSAAQGTAPERRAGAYTIEVMVQDEASQGGAAIVEATPGAHGGWTLIQPDGTVTHVPVEDNRPLEEIVAEYTSASKDPTRVTVRKDQRPLATAFQNSAPPVTPEPTEPAPTSAPQAGQPVSPTQEPPAGGAEPPRTFGAAVTMAGKAKRKAARIAKQPPTTQGRLFGAEGEVVTPAPNTPPKKPPPEEPPADEPPAPPPPPPPPPAGGSGQQLGADPPHLRTETKGTGIIKKGTIFVNGVAIKAPKKGQTFKQAIAEEVARQKAEVAAQAAKPAPAAPDDPVKKLMAGILANAPKPEGAAPDTPLGKLKANIAGNLEDSGNEATQEMVDEMAEATAAVKHYMEEFGKLVKSKGAEGLAEMGITPEDIKKVLAAATESQNALDHHDQVAKAKKAVEAFEEFAKKAKLPPPPPFAKTPPAEPAEPAKRAKRRREPQPDDPEWRKPYDEFWHRFRSTDIIDYPREHQVKILAAADRVTDAREKHNRAKDPEEKANAEAVLMAEAKSAVTVIDEADLTLAPAKAAPEKPAAKPADTGEKTAAYPMLPMPLQPQKGMTPGAARDIANLKIRIDKMWGLYGKAREAWVAANPAAAADAAKAINDFLAALGGSKTAAKYLENLETFHDYMERLLESMELTTGGAVGAAITENREQRKQTGIGFAETGKRFFRRMFRGFGRSSKEGVYNEMSAGEPILGDGSYYAFNEKGAKQYGPNVEAADVELNNPLVIKSDDQWRALTRKAGWEFPNPTGLPKEKQKAGIAKLRAMVEADGHDGIVIDFDDKEPSDNYKGNWIKTLRDVFGMAQAVVFKPPGGGKTAAPAPAKSKPKGKRDAQAAPTGTSAFQRWFSGSKVVDENGDPQVVYHGSPVRGFKEFDLSKVNPNDPDSLVNGFWFSTREESAESSGKFPWGRPNAPDAEVRPFYLSIKNPAARKDVRRVVDEIEDRDEVATREAVRLELQKQGFDGYLHIRAPLVTQEMRDAVERGEKAYLNPQQSRWLQKGDHGGVDLYDKAVGGHVTGYADVDDFLSMSEGVWVAFQPSQIKPADTAQAADRDQQSLEGDVDASAPVPTLEEQADAVDAAADAAEADGHTDEAESLRRYAEEVRKGIAPREEPTDTEETDQQAAPAEEEETDEVRRAKRRTSKKQPGPFSMTREGPIRAAPDNIWTDNKVNPDLIENATPQRRFEKAAELLKKRFGFRKIEMDAKLPIGEAIDALKDAWIGLTNLASVHNVNPEFMSLNGRLALQLHREAAGALAYYSPKDKTIGMTRRNDAFAHEWAHALDHWLIETFAQDIMQYKGRHVTGKTRMGGTSQTMDAQVLDALVDLLNAMYFDATKAAAYVADLELKIQTAKTASQKAALQKKLDTFKAGHSKKQDIISQYYAEAKAHDAKSMEGDKEESYWQRPTEMFARVFEAFTANKIAGLPADHPFVTQSTRMYDESRIGQMKVPYPQGADQANIFNKLETLMKAMRDRGLAPSGNAPNAIEPTDPHWWRKMLPHMPAKGMQQAHSVWRRLKAPFDAAKAESHRADREARARDEQDQKIRDVKLNVRGYGPSGPRRWLANQGIKLVGYIKALPSMLAFTIRGELFSLRDLHKGNLGIKWLTQNFAHDPGANLGVQQKTYTEEIRHFEKHYQNIFGAIIKKHGVRGYDATQLRQLRDVLVNAIEASSVDPAIAAAARDMRRFLNDMYNYNAANGVNLGYAKNGYLPRIIDRMIVEGNVQGFQAQALKLYKLVFPREVGTLDHVREDPLKHPERLKNLTQHVREIARTARVLEAKAGAEALLDDAKRLDKALEELKEATAAGDDTLLLEDEIHDLAEKIYDGIREPWALEAANDWEQRIRGGKTPEFAFDQRDPSHNYMKARVLPVETDEIMGDFLKNDPLELITTYISQSVHRVEFGKFFGNPQTANARQGIQERGLGWKLDDALKAAHEPYTAADGSTQRISDDDYEEIEKSINLLVGRHETMMTRKALRLRTAITALITPIVLARALWSQIAEPITIARATGNYFDIMRVFHAQLQDLLSPIIAKIGLKGPKAQAAWRREMSEYFGVVADNMADSLMLQRYNLMEMNSSDRVHMQRFFRVTGIHPHAMSMRRAATQVFMQRYAPSIAKRALGKGARATLARQALAELGLDSKNDELLRELAALPNVKTAQALEKMRYLDHIRTAVNRFVDSAVLDPKAVDKPRMASMPEYSFMYGILSFQFAFQRHVIIATGKRIANAWEENHALGIAQGLSAIANAQLLMAGQMGAYIMRTIIYSAFNPDDEDDWNKLKDKLVEKHSFPLLGITAPNWVWQGMSRSGLFGAADPIINAFMGLKYERDLSALMAGPMLALPLNWFQQGARALWTGKPLTADGAYKLTEIGWKAAWMWAISKALSRAGAASGLGNFVDAIYGIGLPFMTSDRVIKAVGEWGAEAMTGLDYVSPSVKEGASAGNAADQAQVDIADAKNEAVKAARGTLADEEGDNDTGE